MLTTAIIMNLRDIYSIPSPDRRGWRPQWGMGRELFIWRWANHSCTRHDLVWSP